MKDNLITIEMDGSKKDYKVLAIVDKEYKYIIYTDIENDDIKNNLYVAKVKNLENINETLEISDSEWQMIENEYNKLLNVI